MTVHANEASFRVVKIIFEARYDEGYRYLDHCGEAIVQIRKYDPAWVVVGVNPQSGTLQNASKKLTLNFNTDKLDIANNEEELTLRDAEAKSRALGDEAEKLYHIIVSTLGVTVTTRVGARYLICAGADSLEDADRFLCRGATSPLLQEVVRVTKAELRDASFSYVVEETESGYRRRVALASALKSQAGLPAPTGLGADKGSPSVLVDIDTFTRPSEGHFPRTSIFVQESCLQARRIARSLLDWLNKATNK